jgi:D-lactate dehydrogenase
MSVQDHARLFGGTAVPGNLVEQWKVLKACSAANKDHHHAGCQYLPTGGSTPDGIDYDCDIVIVSTVRIARIRIFNKGRQVKCILATGEGQGDN